MRYEIVLCLVIPLAGCQERVEASKMLGEDECERLVAIVIDMSLSNEDAMTQSGDSFTLDVIDHYFRSSIGSKDRIVIAQISANQENVLLLDATPLRLRQQFPTPDAFKAYLKSKSRNNASPIAEGLTHVVEYVMADPGVASGRTRSAVICLSDMLDNGNPKWRKTVKETIARYAKKGGVVGLYYVSTKYDLVSKWQNYLTSVGMREVCVQGSIVDRPRLPSLD